VELEQAKLVERAVCELMKIFESTPMSNEEKAFVRTTAIAVEDCFQRKF